MTDADHHSSPSQQGRHLDLNEHQNLIDAKVGSVSGTLVSPRVSFDDADPGNLRPLTEVVDPDALDALFAPQIRWGFPTLGLCRLVHLRRLLCRRSRRHRRSPPL